MKDILKKLYAFNWHRPPGRILSAFSNYFPQAINDDWSSENQFWEVVFYDNQVEKIARFTSEGILEEVRINESIKALPDKIYKQINQMGEIMNVILIQKGEQVNWEIIYRDSELKRFLVHIGSDGNQLHKKTL